MTTVEYDALPTANRRLMPKRFTGTLPEFVEFLSEHLCYGGISVGEPEPDDLTGRMIREIRTVTGGYSDDEELLDRVRNGWLGYRWDSTHRGGLTIYKVPADVYDADKESAWIDVPAEKRITGSAFADRAVLRLCHDDGTIVEHRLNKGFLVTWIPDENEERGGVLQIASNPHWRAQKEIDALDDAALDEFDL